MQVAGDWPCVAQGPGPELGGGSTERAASVGMRPGGTSPCWGAGADKAPGSAVAGRRSGMLWGSAMLAKLADAGMGVRHEYKVLNVFGLLLLHSC